LKLFERNLTFRRIAILAIGAFILYLGIDMLYYSYLPSRGSRTYIETRQPVILVVGLMYLLTFIWIKDLFLDTYPLERFKFHGINDLEYINIDLIKADDSTWINKLREKSKKKQLIAYSKNGSFSAKNKAKKLHLEKYFIDFIDYEEIQKRER